MSKLGTYDHIGPLQVEIDMNKLAKLLVEQNYAVHRMLSAIVRERRLKKSGSTELTEGIALLLEKGYH